MLVNTLPEMAAVNLGKVRDIYLGLVRAEEVETLLRGLKVRRLGTAKLEFFLQTLFREKGEEARRSLKSRGVKDKLIVEMLDTMIKNASKDSRKRRGQYWHLISTIEVMKPKLKKDLGKIHEEGKRLRTKLKDKIQRKGTPPTEEI